MVWTGVFSKRRKGIDMKITYSTFSEKGVRNENQDFIQTVIDENKGRHAFILCDGMGGHAHGGLAARIVSTSIARDIKQNTPADMEGIRSIISRAAWTPRYDVGGLR